MDLLLLLAVAVTAVVSALLAIWVVPAVLIAALTALAEDAA